MKLGIISDTHGYVHPQIAALFDGVECILHAGDVDTEDALLELQAIAPVIAARGNMDRFGRLASHREVVFSAFGSLRVCKVHDLGSTHTNKPALIKPLRQYAPDVVIFGHTHIPYLATHHETLFLNPGSARQGRQGSPASVGLLEIVNNLPTGRILPLDT